LLERSVQPVECLVVVSLEGVDLGDLKRRGPLVLLDELCQCRLGLFLAAESVEREGPADSTPAGTRLLLYLL